MMCHTTYYEWRLHRRFRGDSISMKAGKISQVCYGEYRGKNPHQKGIQDIQSQKFNELKRSSSTSVQHPGFYAPKKLPIPPKKWYTSFLCPPKKMATSHRLRGSWNSKGNPPMPPSPQEALGYDGD